MLLSLLTVKLKKEKKEKKAKKRKHDETEEVAAPAVAASAPAPAAAPAPERSYDDLVKRVCVIAKPLAGEKLTKKLYKAVKKAHGDKRLSRGVKEVGKSLRKGEKGVVVFAGDISPIDVIAHMPVLCEDAGVPYCYVPSKEDLGAAGQTKRPTSVVLVKGGDADIKAAVESLPAPF